MVWLILLLFLVFPKVVLAAPLIIVDSVPTSGVIGNTFPVTFSVSNADIGPSYFYKVFGGPDNSSIKTFSNGTLLPYTGHPWSEYPLLTLDQGGSATVNTFASGVAAADNYVINVRIYNIGTSAATDAGTNTKTISLIAPTATPVPPTNTPTITPTPTPTNTPAPTNTVAPSATNTPTKTPTKIPTPTETPEPTLNIPTPEPLSSEDAMLQATPTVESTATPTPQITANGTPVRKNILPVIFIAAGGLLLLIPVVISKIPS